jgi:RimJ/RimL family protein N-acetyltransferase
VADPLTDVDALAPVVAAFPFKPYRHYRTFSRRQQDAVLLAELRDTAAHGDGFVVAAGEGAARAAVAGRALAWDTRHFGLPMGRLEYVLAGDQTSQATVAEAVDAALAAARARGVRHLSARVDVADLRTLGLLEARGFRLLDALVTYINRPVKDPARDVREVGAIRHARPEDAGAIVEIARDAYRGYRGRYHLDPHVPVDRADALYVAWAEETAAMRMADTVLVSEGPDGRLVGFLGWRRREPVSTHGGMPVFGGGLGACRRDAPGGYAGLIRAGTVWAHEHGGVAECQTQNYNFAVIRVYEAVGAHYVRAEYTLHAWLT